MFFNRVNWKFKTILPIVLFTIGIVLANNDETIYFADKILEKAICAKLRIKPPVSKSTILNLTSMDSFHYTGRIRSLKGIEFAVNLKSFRLEGHDVSDVSPLSDLKSLKELRLTNSKVVDVSSLKKLTNLSILELVGNQIEDISAISELSNLKRLTLTLNPLNEEAYEIYIPKIIENNPNIVLYHDRAPNPAKSLNMARRLIFPVLGFMGLLFFLRFKYPLFLRFKYPFRTKKHSK